MKKALLLTLAIMLIAAPCFAGPSGPGWFKNYINGIVDHPQHQQDVTYVAFVRAPNLVQFPLDINLEAVVEKDVEVDVDEGWTVKAGLVIPWGINLKK